MSPVKTSALAVAGTKPAEEYRIHTVVHGDTPVSYTHLKELLTEDVVELLTTPLDLAGYKTAITEALYKGTKRNVESEKDAKNAQVG